MKEFLREYFSFSDRERNGVVVLLAIIAGLIVVLNLQDKFVSLPKEDFSKFDKMIAEMKNSSNKDSMQQPVTSTGSATDPSSKNNEQNFRSQKQLFNFDPNKNSEADWIKLGLTPGQARVVKNYMSRGATFKTKDDVKKLFVVSEELFNSWKPYILLPDKTDDVQTATAPATHSATHIVELNTADSLALISVNGIGPAFAHRILSYRDRLGGFHSENQLTEIYGMDSTRYSQLKNFLTVDSSLVKKIDINTVEAADLKKQVYFSWNIANALVNYRKSHGNYHTLADIKKCNLVSDELYRKIAPYLTL